MQFIEAITLYLSFHFALLPVAGKRPTPKNWKQFQYRQPNRDELTEWIKDPRVTGLAAILGSISRELSARDFDKPEAYERWKTKYPELAKTLPTYRTSRGFVVLFISKSPVRTRSFGADGELRGEGAIVVLPPSMHPSGVQYAWVVPLGAVIPEADPENFIESKSSESQLQKEHRIIPPHILVHAALKKVKEGKPRNEMGFWLVCQLRDSGVAEDAAAVHVLNFQRQVPPHNAQGQCHAYTELEALESLRQAFSRAPREGSGDCPKIQIITATELGMESELLPELISGLVRRRELLNIIGPTKVGKSFLVRMLEVLGATGGDFLGYKIPRQLRVLVKDTELHRQTAANRHMRVMSDLNIRPADIGDRIHYCFLRGMRLDLEKLRDFLLALIPGQYDLIIIDALYRLLPENFDENSNADMARLYNLLDEIAARMDAAVVIVHHSTKGDQSEKSITAVGAGAGALSRATDTHLIFRQHEVPDCYVVEARCRTFKSPEPVVVQFEYPLWKVRKDLDPTSIFKPGRKASPTGTGGVTRDAGWFALTVASSTPQTKTAIIAEATNIHGLSQRRADGLFAIALSKGLLHQWPNPGGRRNVAYLFANVAPPMTGGIA